MIVVNYINIIFEHVEHLIPIILILEKRSLHHKLKMFVFLLLIYLDFRSTLYSKTKEEKIKQQMQPSYKLILIINILIEYINDNVVISMQDFEKFAIFI